MSPLPSLVYEFRLFTISMGPSNNLSRCRAVCTSHCHLNISVLLLGLSSAIRGFAYFGEFFATLLQLTRQRLVSFFAFASGNRSATSARRNGGGEHSHDVIGNASQAQRFVRACVRHHTRVRCFAALFILTSCLDRATGLAFCTTGRVLTCHKHHVCVS